MGRWGTEIIERSLFHVTSDRASSKRRKPLEGERRSSFKK